MKKVILSALAIVSLVACSKDEIVNQQTPGAIGFSGAFVDNATRAAADPSTTTESIKSFGVWGFIENTDGVIFEDEKVTKVGVNWTYKNTQYWSPNHTYYFAALSPADQDSNNVTVTPATGDVAKSGLGVVDFANVDGSEDLLYAEATRTTGTDITEQPDPVAFTFNHLLSKVKFTFENGFTNENTELVVKDVEMVAPGGASIHLSAAEPVWTLAQNFPAVTLDFGDVNRLAMGAKDEAANERLTIPAAASQKYNVTFTVELYQGDVLAQTFDEETVIEGVELEKGKAYNFTAALNANNLGLYPITFEVDEIIDWDTQSVKELALEDVIVDGGSMTLVADGKAASTINVKNGGSLDGAGHTLSVDTQDNAALAEFFTASTLRYLTTTNGATIQNLTIDGNNAVYNSDKNYGIRAFFLTGEGDVNIDNVVVKNVTYALNTGSTSGAGINLNVSNSTLEGWSSWDGTASATFTNVTFAKNATNGLGNVRPYHSTEFINCTFGEGVTIDLSMLEAGQTITFVDCKYANGTPVSDANIKAHLASDSEAKLSQVVFFGAVANVEAGQTTTLTEDAVSVSSVKVEGGADAANAATLDGGGNTLTVAGNPGDNGIVRPSGNANIQNITIDGQSATYDGDKGMRAIYITKGGVYNIDNVNIFNVTYTINVNTTQAVTLNVSDSTLAGWTSYGGSTTANFTNVTFKVGDYAMFRPYGNTVMKDCNFENGMEIDLGSIGSNSITFENCYYAGEKITAANVASLVEGETASTNITCQ